MGSIDNNDAWNLTIEFTKSNWDIDNIMLNETTRLQEDLGIKGDDADEFIYRFAQNFNIDATHVDLSNYFTGNDFDFITSVVRLFKRESAKKKMALTLGDLRDAILIGKLDDKVLLNKELNKKNT